MIKDIVYLYVVGVLCIDYVKSESLVVKTPLGDVAGHLMQTARGKRPVYAFTAIPYAEPPVKSLRFKVGCQYISRCILTYNRFFYQAQLILITYFLFYTYTYLVCTFYRHRFR